MPGPLEVHIKWSSSKRRRLSYMICPLNLPKDKIFLQDIFSFSKTGKKALRLRDQLFHKLLSLHFDDIDVLRHFTDDYQRFTAPVDDHQSFRKIDLVFYDINDATISGLWSLKPLYGVSHLEVYLLQSPGQQPPNKEDVNTLRSLPAHQVDIHILEGIETDVQRIDPRLLLTDHYLGQLAQELVQELKERDKRTSRGYAYHYPHERCALEAARGALEQLKRADEAIQSTKRGTVTIKLSYKDIIRTVLRALFASTKILEHHFASILVGEPSSAKLRRRADKTDCTLQIQADGQNVYEEPLYTNNGQFQDVTSSGIQSSDKPEVQVTQKCGDKPSPLTVNNVRVGNESGVKSSAGSDSGSGGSGSGGSGGSGSGSGSGSSGKGGSGDKTSAATGASASATGDSGNIGAKTKASIGALAAAILAAAAMF
ncbi:hypothetical protein FBULB1_3464 [Fusarium bulbicola]|nr:hypothetical protein FBULB1_3464 [Fusarium bulbicola]